MTLPRGRDSSRSSAQRRLYVQPLYRVGEARARTGRRRRRAGRASASARASQSAPSASAYGYHCAPDRDDVLAGRGEGRRRWRRSSSPAGPASRGSRAGRPVAVRGGEVARGRCTAAAGPRRRRRPATPGIRRQRRRSAPGRRGRSRCPAAGRRRPAAGGASSPARARVTPDVAGGDDGAGADPPSRDASRRRRPRPSLDQQPGGAVAEGDPAAVGLQPRGAAPSVSAAGAADGVAGRDVVQQRRPADHRGGAGLGHRRPGLGAEPGQRRLEPLAGEPAVEQRVAGAEEVDGQVAARRCAGGPSTARRAARRSGPAGGRRPSSERGGDRPAARRPHRHEPPVGRGVGRPAGRRDRGAGRVQVDGEDQRLPVRPGVAGEGRGRSPTGRSRRSAGRGRRGRGPRRCRCAG